MRDISYSLALDRIYDCSIRFFGIFSWWKLYDTGSITRTDDNRFYYYYYPYYYYYYYYYHSHSDDFYPVLYEKRDSRGLVQSASSILLLQSILGISLRSGKPPWVFSGECVCVCVCVCVHLIITMPCNCQSAPARVSGRMWERVRLTSDLKSLYKYIYSLYIHMHNFKKMRVSERERSDAMQLV